MLWRRVSCVNVICSPEGISIPEGNAMMCLSSGTGGVSRIPLKSHQATSSPFLIQKSSLNPQLLRMAARTVKDMNLV